MLKPLAAALNIDSPISAALPAQAEFDIVARIICEQGGVVQRFSLDSTSSAFFPIENWLTALLGGEFDDVIVQSPQGVRLLSELAGQLNLDGELVRALGKTRLIVQGARAEGALRELGLSATVLLRNGALDPFVALLETLDFRGRVVGFVPGAGDARLTALITSRGGSTKMLTTADDTVASASNLLQSLVAARVKLLLLNSASEVQCLWQTAGLLGAANDLTRALASSHVIALGEDTQRALEQHDIAVRFACSRGEFFSTLAASLYRSLGLPLGEDKGARAELSPIKPSERETPDGPELQKQQKFLSGSHKKTVLVVGNGMVGHRFVEHLTELDQAQEYQIVVLCEEPRPAYDRVKLTSYFAHKDAAELALTTEDWYREHGVKLLLGDKASKLDRSAKAVLTASGEWIPYDVLVFATGSSPFVPPVVDTHKAGIFVYRTIEDLDGIIRYAGRSKRAAVLGGGLLGLEAAKAAADLGLETHVVEFAPRLMPRQLDARGAGLLARRIEELGVFVHVNKSLSQVVGTDRVTALRFSDGSQLDMELLIVSAGIRPRDELARAAGLTLGERGGIQVNDGLETSDPNIFAIGECAVHSGVVYGLVAPGYEMAQALAKRLCHEPTRFSGTDQSAKLKLLGVDVASLGDPFADGARGRAIVYEDLVRGVYKKLVLSEDCKQLIGAILVGDASEYGQLLHLMRSATELPSSPEQLILGVRDGSSALAQLPDTAQICSCNNVSRKAICDAVKGGANTLPAVKSCTRAGTGCGGCLPQVSDIIKAELKAAGQVVKEHLCEHFPYSRQELYQIIKINKLQNFDAVAKSHGHGHGCEICKPTVASILASVHNELILKHDTLQDTNDRFLANIQRGGLYSVVPRIPAGEITPEKLIVIGEVAKKYSLYTKITGGQRIDLLGARVDQLPEIWADLVAAGFESGHAYGKSMRTVKSCVGSSWCRFGVQDSVSFAIRIEERYKGIRAPHKLKSAVSGCIRECAEAQSKDFGLIATEKGYNLYVCGNGGIKPRHADLLAQDLDEDTAIKYIDRMIMYYMSTADRLTRTSTWLERMEGGIEYLKEVVVNDKLGICAQLESDMQGLVDSYACEWTEVVKNPELRARFRHFVNSKEAGENIQYISERGQRRPADWPKADKKVVSLPILNNAANGAKNGGANGIPAANRKLAAPESNGHGKSGASRTLAIAAPKTSWVAVTQADQVPGEGGIAVKYGNTQLAVYNFASRGQWYATQNTCPHMKDMVLARGLIGDQAGKPKVACPQHKKTFSLESGESLSGDDLSIRTFAVKVEDGVVYLDLPSVEVIEQLLPCHDDAACSHDLAHSNELQQAAS